MADQLDNWVTLREPPMADWQMVKKAGRVPSVLRNLTNKWIQLRKTYDAIEDKMAKLVGYSSVFKQPAKQLQDLLAAEGIIAKVVMWFPEDDFGERGGCVFDHADGYIKTRIYDIAGDPKRVAEIGQNFLDTKGHVHGNEVKFSISLDW